MKRQTQIKTEYPFALRPASREEAGLFYSQLDEAEDTVLGTVGHVRIDFGSSGKGTAGTNSGAGCSGNRKGLCAGRSSGLDSEKSARRRARYSDPTKGTDFPDVKIFV